MARGDEQRDRARLANGHGRLDVALEEEPLHGHAVGLMLRDESVQGRLELCQALGVRPGRQRSDNPGIDQPQAVGLEGDDTEPEGRGARIDANGDHGAIVVGGTRPDRRRAAARRPTLRAAP